MDYKGYCLWASDVPAIGVPHYVIVSSGRDDDDNYLIVAISSIKYKPDWTPRYFDESCVINVDDLKDENGNNILNKPSFARYQYSCVKSGKELLQKQISRGYSCKCKVSEELLRRIQKGAMISKDLPDDYKRFFAYF